MMNVREIQLNNEGKIIGLKGSFKRQRPFSSTTTKVYFWSFYELDYAGGWIEWETIN